MSGVLIAYPGVIAPRSTHSQRVPHGQRAFGIPNELIVRMQQNEQTEPVHLCDVRPWLGTDAMHCRTRGVPRAVVDTWLTSLTPPAGF